MRIDTNSVFTGRVTGEKTTGKAKSVAGNIGSDQTEDKATLSADAAAVQSLQAQVMQMPEIRQDTVDGLREQVRQGSYRIESGKVADAIIAAHQG
jgi:flagellar biosynthesis anti-sigma factor FlgM